MKLKCIANFDSSKFLSKRKHRKDCNQKHETFFNWQQPRINNDENSKLLNFFLKISSRSKYSAVIFFKSSHPSKGTYVFHWTLYYFPLVLYLLTNYLQASDSFQLQFSIRNQSSGILGNVGSKAIVPIEAFEQSILAAFEYLM